MTMTDNAAEQQSDLEDVLAGLSAFLSAEVIPTHQKLVEAAGGKTRLYQSNGRFTDDVLDAMREVREASAEAGYYSMLAPMEVGGGALGFEALYRTWELIYRQCGPMSWLGAQAVAHWARGPGHVLLAASKAAKDRLLPDLLSGSITLCFAMSEPDAGSDVWQMRTRAERTADGWLLAGTKQWITNGPYAEWAVVFAVSDPAAFAAHAGGLTAFLVETSDPGFRVDSVIEMFGHPGGDEAVISMDDVFVHDEMVLGEEGAGLQIALGGVSTGRLYNSARSVGLARWALDLSIRYAEERSTFGRPIIENQAISHPMAEAAMAIYAADLMGLDCARRLDAGLSVRKELSMAKAFSTESATRIIDRAMQAHGAMGLTNEVGLSEAWHQVRRICIADGSAEIMREQIVKQLRRGQ